MDHSYRWFQILGLNVCYCGWMEFEGHNGTGRTSNTIELWWTHNKTNHLLKKMVSDQPRSPKGRWPKRLWWLSQKTSREDEKWKSSNS